MIKEETARQLVSRALKTIADFDGEIDKYSTAHLHELQIDAFLTALSKFVAEEPVVDNDGNTRPDLKYRVSLSRVLFNKWTTFGDCIIHLVKKSSISRV
ncbi:MAG: hypothetical protein IH597_09845 [Bacteroidales bacterium]|nr:hypothetical protein [Bacteroidales bacterium]